MKKSTILFTIVCITMLACNQKNQKEQNNQFNLGPQAPPSTFKVKDSIPRAKALSMIQHYRNHYLDSTLIGHSNMDTAIITLNNSDLDEIFKLDNMTRIRFISAAYLPSDPDSSLHNKVTVLMQLRQGYTSTYSYYDSKLLGYICPPPPGCAVE